MGEWDVVTRESMQTDHAGTVPASGDWEIVRREPVGPEKGTDWGRVGAQAFGGMVGGFMAAPTSMGLATPMGIALGSSMAGQVYDRGAELAGRKPKATMGEAAMTAAEDFFFDAVSPVAISKGIYAAKKIGGAVVQKATGAFAPVELSLYKRLGLEPTASMVTQSRGLMAAENALSDYALSSGVMQEVAQRNLEQLKFSSEYLAREYGDTLTTEELGTLLKQGAKGALEKLDGVYGKLFSRVSQEIGTTPWPVENTRKMLAVLAEEAKIGPESGIGGIANDIIQKAGANGGGLPFDALKKFRTKVGDLMKDPSLISTRDIQSGDLKRLYSALSQDMEYAAKQAGPQAHAKWRAANKYYEVSLVKKVPILEGILKKGYDEEAFGLAMRASKEGGSRLRALRRQLDNEQWGAVAGTVFNKLGKATPGAQDATGKAFSVQTFLTNWNRLAPEAKQALWAGTRHQELYHELDNFARVVSDMKNVERMVNTSKTGSTLMFFGLLQSIGAASGGVTGGVSGAAAGMAASAPVLIAPYYAAKLLTNQKFVSWLAEGVKVTATDPNAMKVHLGRLWALREEEDIQEAVDQVIKKALE